MEEVSASSVVVSIVGVDGNPDLVLYKATAEGGGAKHECKVTRETVPLSCSITGLQVVTRYAIAVRSCLSGDRCGSALTKQFETKLLGIFAHGSHEAFKITCIDSLRFCYSAAEC